MTLTRNYLTTIRNISRKSNFQFQENRIKTVALRVPPWLIEHMTVVTSSNLLIYNKLNHKRAQLDNQRTH